MSDIDLADDLYEERELRLEDQDLRLLKGILTNQKSARDFVSVYDHNLFVGDAQNFAKAAISYYKNYGTMPTRRVMLDSLKSSPTFYEEVEYVWNILDNVECDKAEFNYDLDKAKNRFTKRNILRIKRELDEVDLADENYDETIKSIRSSLEETEKVRKGRKKVYIQKTIKDYLPEFQSNFIAKFKDKGLGRGALTGYSYLDYVKNGLHPSDMLIIGGETGAGKSFLLSNMAIQMWMQKNTIKSTTYTKGNDVLFFSLEMPYEQCFRRAMARIGDLPTYGIRDAHITPDQADRLNSASKFIKEFPQQFEIVDIPRGVTAEQIEERYKESIASGRNPGIVVVDYLGLMESSDSPGDDWLKLGHIAGKLHEFARTYNLILLTAVQLNRPIKSANKDSRELIGLHRIGRSSLIMHHATVGVQIESRKDEHTFSDMIYHIIKNRDGELGQHTVDKNFRNATVKDIEPYIPPTSDDIDAFTSVNMVEDISKQLENYGWAQ